MYEIYTKINDYWSPKGKVNNRTANYIMDTTRGHFDDVHFKGEQTKRAFIIEEFTCVGYNSISICLWVGDKLVPCDY